MADETSNPTSKNYEAEVVWWRVTGDADSRALDAGIAKHDLALAHVQAAAALFGETPWDFLARFAKETAITGPPNA